MESWEPRMQALEREVKDMKTDFKDGVSEMRVANHSITELKVISEEVLRHHSNRHDSHDADIEKLEVEQKETTKIQNAFAVNMETIKGDIKTTGKQVAWMVAIAAAAVTFIPIVYDLLKP